MTRRIDNSARRPQPHLDRLLLHVVNAAWMSYLAARAYLDHDTADRNFLADPVLLVLLSLAAALHSTHWHRLSRQQLAVTCTSERELRMELERTARDLLGSIPYWLKLLPTSNALEKRAAQVVSEGPVILRTRLDVVRLLLCTPRLRPMHLMAAVASGAFLWVGDFPSFAAPLSPFWPALAIALVFAAGMVVQSTVLLLFGAIQFDSTRGGARRDA